MAGLPRPAQINTCSRPKFSRSLEFIGLGVVDHRVMAPSVMDGGHRENAGIAENISPPAANRSQPVPAARRLSRSQLSSRKFVGGPSLADLGSRVLDGRCLPKMGSASRTKAA
jgi:hypothetical protein